MDRVNTYMISVALKAATILRKLFIFTSKMVLLLTVMYNDFFSKIARFSKTDM